MEGRIIAIRVTDGDFSRLEELKKREGVGWNQLLLQPVERAYDVILESAGAKTPKEEKPPKADKTKKAGKKAKKGKKVKVTKPVDEGQLVTVDQIEEPAGDDLPATGREYTDEELKAAEELKAGELEGDPPAGDPQTNPTAEELEASEA